MFNSRNLLSGKRKYLYGLISLSFYFCTYRSHLDELLWWQEILSFEIRPLMEEIWFDDLGKVNKMMDILNQQ